MTRKTHAVYGILSSSLIMNPNGYRAMATCLVFATLGSIICDIDSVNSSSHKYIKKIIVTCLLFVILGILLDYRFKLNILNMMINENMYIRIIMLGIFCLVCAHGMHLNHRSFMHSIMATILLSGLMYFIYKNGSIPFMIGMFSHIILDLFNYKGVQVFYPIKKRISFDLCASDGIINDILFVSGIILLIFL